MAILDIDIQEKDGARVIRLSGRLVGTELGRLQHDCLTALQHIQDELVIDLAGVEYIDSLSIGRLVALNATASKSGKRIVLLGPRADVLGTLRMLQIDKVLTIR